MNVPHRMNLLYSIPEIHRTKILYIIITTKFVNSIPKPIVHKTTLFHPVQHFRKMTQLFEFIPMSSYAYIAANLIHTIHFQNSNLKLFIFLFLLPFHHLYILHELNLVSPVRALSSCHEDIISIKANSIFCS